ALANARESGGMVAVAFIDLDTFKQINDTLGHEAGDTVLQEIAGRFAGCIEDGDTLARMGGDEFTAIFNDVAAQTEAIAHAQRLLASLRKPCHVSDHELFVSASIGIRFFPIDGEDAATL